VQERSFLLDKVGGSKAEHSLLCVEVEYEGKHVATPNNIKYDVYMQSNTS
jgi:hypothetical protein